MRARSRLISYFDGKRHSAYANGEPCGCGRWHELSTDRRRDYGPEFDPQLDGGSPSVATREPRLDVTHSTGFGPVSSARISWANQSVHATSSDASMIQTSAGALIPSPRNISDAICIPSGDQAASAIPSASVPRTAPSSTE